MKRRALRLTATLVPIAVLLVAFTLLIKPSETGPEAAGDSEILDLLAAEAPLPHVAEPHAGGTASSNQIAGANGDSPQSAALAERLERARKGIVENFSGHDLVHIPEGVTQIEEVLYREIAPADARGLVRRTHVLKTDFHFPLVQTVELIATDPETGEDSVVAYKSMVADHLLVQLDPQTRPADWNIQLAERDVRVRREVTRDGLYLLEFSVHEAGEAFDRMESLKKDFDWVRFAEPDFLVARRGHEDPVPNDSSFDQLWGLRNTGQLGGKAGMDIKAVEAWAMQEQHPQLKGEAGAASSAIVAILDTGVDYSHLDLKENMWVNPRETRDSRDNSGSGIVDDIHGANVITLTGDPMDWHSHGTHVAGTVGAVANNNHGVSGVAWDVQLMAVTILYPGGTLSDIIRGIDYAWENGAHVLNNSWGVIIYNARLFGVWRSEALADAILRTRNAGAIFVTAAGNDFENVDIFPDFPAGHQAQADNVVNVAALDRRGDLAFFSNYGPNNVQVGAPGHEILSTVPGGYDTFSGTSMAAPHIAGMFAVLKHEYPNESYRTLIQRLLQRSDKERHLAQYIGIGRRANLARALDPKPLIDEPLEDFEFLPGSDVTLRIGVSSSGGSSSIQWFKNGVLISGATGDTLTLGPADRSLTGVYRAEVTNAYGTSVTEALVMDRPVHPELGEAVGAPELTWTSSAEAAWQPANDGGAAAARSGDISHNGSTEISTTVTGPGTLRFSWRVSSEANYDTLRFAVNGQVRETISGESGWLHRTVAISHGSHELTWRYSKDGSRSDGDDAGWVADVRYETDHPVIDSHTLAQEVVAGSSVTLSMQARGSGSLTYYWKKDGTLLTGKNAAGFTLDSVTASDAGIYVGTVSNSHGIASTAAIALSVVDEANAPEISRDPEGFVGEEGAWLTLSAGWRGTSPFTLQWYKDGEAIPGATDGILRINGLTLDDSGSYHLAVENEAGIAETFPASVRVHPARDRFSAWVARHGGIEEIRQAIGAHVEPVLYFALGITPNESAAGKLPRLALVREHVASVQELSISAAEEGPLHAALLFERPSNLDGVAYLLEATEDLRNWEETESSLEVLDIYEDGRQAVRLREMAPVSSDQTRRFLRLRVDVEE